MKTIQHHLTLLALALAASAANASAAADDDQPLRAAIRRENARLESAAPAEKSRSKSQRKSGLQTASLGGASLQPSGGLTSAARGLTPKDEWRRTFPRKEQP